MDLANFEVFPPVVQWQTIVLLYLGGQLPGKTWKVINYEKSLSLSVTCLDNFLQIPPGFFKSLHSKPSIRVGGYTETLDLAIELCQLVEVSLGRTKWRAESIMSFSQCFDFFQWVTAHRICQVLFSILKPAVEGGCLLCEGQEQILNLEKRKKSSSVM